MNLQRLVFWGHLTLSLHSPTTLFLPCLKVEQLNLIARDQRGGPVFCLTPTVTPVPQKGKERVAQSCFTLCDPMDYTVHGILQARILEWVAFPFSRGSSQPRDQTQVSRIAGRFLTS